MLRLTLMGKKIKIFKPKTEPNKHTFLLTFLLHYSLLSFSKQYNLIKISKKFKYY